MFSSHDLERERQDLRRDGPIGGPSGSGRIERPPHPALRAMGAMGARGVQKKKGKEKVEHRGDRAAQPSTKKDIAGTRKLPKNLNISCRTLPQTETKSTAATQSGVLFFYALGLLYLRPILAVFIIALHFSPSSAYF